ncbi:MAG: Pseudouridine kinase, partial [Chlamydiae bacterium]|nr:Pseudouridine kinase [Chlamydiota bacterium]
MLRAILFAAILLFQVGVRGESYDPNAPKEYAVLSLSAAIIDHFFTISDQQLNLVTNEKGSWAPIDYATLTSILDRNQGASKMLPGGSGANVMKGLAQLGEACAIVGKVGSDDKGEYYIKRMNELGVGTYLERGRLPTGQAICLITPDGERTFRTYLGASHSLTDLNLDPQIFHTAELFHLEGYQLVDQDLVIRTLRMAKDANVKVSMDLANVEVVRRHKEFISKILDKYIDILFCNE